MGTALIDSRIWLLRRVLGDPKAAEAMELLTKRLKGRASNAAFLNGLILTEGPW